MMRNYIFTFLSRRNCYIRRPAVLPHGSIGAIYVQFSKFSTEPPQRKKTNYIFPAAVAIFGTTITWGVYSYIRGHQKLRETVHAASQQLPGEYKSGLPEYSLDEVAKHNDKSSGVWVTFGHGVYDITPFIEQHPGGDKILMAAGGSLEPFWALYAVHKQQNVLELLEGYRIGNLSQSEKNNAMDSVSDPYAYEPRRHPALKPSSQKPFNAETPLSLLVESFITPSHLFYVRNHLPVPDVDLSTYELEVEGLDAKGLVLSLDELKTKFPKHTVTAAVQCAGNRRSEMAKVKAIRGLSWGQAAIGNAVWSGAKLADVLKAAGYKDNHPKAQHVQFEGLDTDVSNMPYGASVPFEKAIDPRNDVLLAYEMNGEPLSRDHGFPVRVIVPGVIGARQVKWLGRIIVSEEESDSQWQQRDYKGFSPSVDWDTVDFSKSPAIQEFPVTSAICTPLQGETVSLVNGKLVVKGYAWSGGGQKIIRVDITVDQGKTWHNAEITDEDSTAKAPHNWAWSLWKAEIPIPPRTKKVEIWAKAVDSGYNTQPESFENIWNLRGVLSNAYHRVKVNIKS
ncbi:sulfite oxidase-like [Schistocerca americana]|uniref:sulfite oxidase-like n=1 Tax=Schistocerca americana TaxID=7009 RepID=UPI001F5040D3|nr:sulfite oxidase-like [Schistocerca americana]